VSAGDPVSRQMLTQSAAVTQPHRHALVGSLGDARPEIHPEAWIAPGAVVIGSVTLERGASVWYGAVLRADEATITVGPETNIQDLCCLHVDPGAPIVLAERVTLGHGATVHGAHVEAGAVIGIGAVVLNGARIGAGSIVAAGAVVRPGTIVPAGVLVAGVPGRVVRPLEDGDVAAFAGTAARYVQRAARHRQAVWHGAHQYRPWETTTLDDPLVLVQGDDPQYPPRGEAK
jgi:carbonic anhydrase/acetyltransferase-like protein (isoleucine patch superfamily)